MNMEIYTSKHEVIKQLLSEINSNLSNCSDNADVISSAVNKLYAVVQMHLASEDKYLYPALLQSKNPSTRVITQSYMKEMEGLAQAFIDFATKYRTTGLIKSDCNGFVSSFRNVDSALRLRMEREEKELYLLV